MSLKLVTGTPIELTQQVMAENQTLDLSTETTHGALPGEYILTKVPYVSQDPYLNLCWAACASMVLECLRPGGNEPLCQIVTNVLGQNCCPGFELLNCDKTAWPYEFFKKYVISFTPNKAIDSESVEEWIEFSQSPVQVYIAWNGGGAHTALIVGYNSANRFLVYDPKWKKGYYVSYDYLLNGYGGRGRWTNTWYGMKG